MSYEYLSLREKLFTDEGQRALLATRDHVQACLKLSGAVTMWRAMSPPRGGCGDSWLAMACVDRLLELGEIREVEQARGTWAQNRIFVEVR